MGKSSNPGNFLDPTNIVKTIVNPIIAPIDYGLKSIKRNLKPPDIPQVTAPTILNNTPPPTPDSSAASNSPEMVAQRKNKLAALRLGFASTISNMYGQRGLGSGAAGAKSTLGS